MKKAVSIKLMRAEVEKLVSENNLQEAYDLTLQIRSIDCNVQIERNNLALIIKACEENIEAVNAGVYLNACNKLGQKPDEEIVKKFLAATNAKGDFLRSKLLVNTLGFDLSPEMLRQIIVNDVSVLNYHIQDIEAMFNSEVELNKTIELAIGDLVEAGNYYDALEAINFIGRKPSIYELRTLSDKAINDDAKIKIDMDIINLEKN